ncbi:MAG: DUF6493 family protein [Nocardiopsaceae bacterium]|jgi:hypothetical protein|nr:DUF6493 family protein [Nocardiopsaceae bacterium]
MTIDPALLRDAITANDATKVRQLLVHASEADRRACAEAMQPFFRGPRFSFDEHVMITSAEDLQDFVAQLAATRSVARTDEDREFEQWNEQRCGAAFVAAELGLAGGVAAAIRAADDYPSYETPSDADLVAVAGVLADRAPAWLADFADRRLEAEFSHGFSAWRLARRLVRIGAIDRPDVPGYATTFGWQLLHRSWSEDNSAGSAKAVHDALLADKGLLDDEVWRLFTVPDAAWRLSSEWADALALLAAEGQLDRDRLIDAALDAFTRDFAPSRVSWYAVVHDALKPTIDEMSAGVDKYLRLLQVEAKPGILLGQKSVSMLLDADLIAAQSVLQAAAAGLVFPQKSVALAQLKLISKIAARFPASRDAAMVVAAHAFGHQREDVQEAALSLIARYGVPTGPSRGSIETLATALSPNLAAEAAAIGLGRVLEAARPHVANVAARLEVLDRRIRGLPHDVRGRLQVLLDEARAGAVAGPVTVTPSAGARLADPIDDPEELIQLLGQLMEDACDPLAVERAIAGAVRLSALPPGERAKLAAPLIKRAMKRAEEDFGGPFSGYEITSDLACLTLAWGAGWSERDIDRDNCWWSFVDAGPVLPTGDARTMAGVLTARIWEAATLVGEGNPVRLLAEPEFERGAVSHERLLQRLAARQSGAPRSRPPRYDLELALLRLAPEVPDDFWSTWARYAPTTARRARSIYEQCQVPPAIRPHAGVPLDKFSGESYEHQQVLASISDVGATAGEIGSRTWELLTTLGEPFRQHRKLYGERWQIRHYGPVVAEWPLLCPWQPELAAAHLLRPLSDGLKAGPTAATTAVRCLAHAGHPLGVAGHVALVTALTSGEPDTRIAAAEVWAAAAHDGRLDPALAADAIALGVTGEAYKVNRLADGLEYASREPLPGFRVIQTIFLAAKSLLDTKARNLHLLLELAGRIGAITGLPELPAAISGLSGRRTSTKLTAAAARISRMCAAPSSAVSSEVIEKALIAHVDRVVAQEPTAPVPSA